MSGSEGLAPGAPLFASAHFAARGLVEADLPRLQALFEANPEYFVAVSGRPPGPDAARVEFDDRPPPHLPWTRRWFLGLHDGAGAMVGVADVVSDLSAPGVWHIALFLLATPLHGTGAAHEVYAALEGWIAGSGARWLRLGVVRGNARAERFWQGRGYRETRVRGGVDTGGRVNDVRVMVKALAGGTLAEYRDLVARDRPDSPLP